MKIINKETGAILEASDEIDVYKRQALSGMDGFGFTTQTTTCWKEYAM